MKKFAVILVVLACVAFAGCSAIKETLSPKGFLVLHEVCVRQGA